MNVGSSGLGRSGLGRSGLGRSGLGWSGLGSSERPLSDVHDLAMLDLDGVVYVGSGAVPGAVEAAQEARSRGLRVAYLTNNASRSAAAVADHLRDLGIVVDDADVVTSAQAVAHLVADAVPPGSAVLVVGGPGLRSPLEERGLRCVHGLDDDPVAVVQGFDPELGWRSLAEASYAVAAGLPWFASNTDLTIPTARGIAPGNGSLVQAVRTATGAEPVVAGKPERALFDETLDRIGAKRPIMVGDRLDTDVDGAINAGITSMAVLTGVSTLADVMAAQPGHRPDYVGHDLYALLSEHPPVTVGEEVVGCGTASASVEGDTAVLTSGDPGSLEALRAVVALAWSARDTSGRCLRPGGMMAP